MSWQNELRSIPIFVGVCVVSVLVVAAFVILVPEPRSVPAPNEHFRQVLLSFPSEQTDYILPQSPEQGCHPSTPCYSLGTVNWTSTALVAVGINESPSSSTSGAEYYGSGFSGSGTYVPCGYDCGAMLEVQSNATASITLNITFSGGWYWT